MRHGVVLYGGGFEPVGGFLRTVFHALAVVVNHAELRCGAAVVEFGGFKVEFACRGVVLLPADAFLISQCFLKGFFDVLEYQRGPFDVFVVVLVVQGGVAQEFAAGGEAACFGGLTVVVLRGMVVGPDAQTVAVDVAH